MSGSLERLLWVGTANLLSTPPCLENITWCFPENPFSPVLSLNLAVVYEVPAEGGGFVGQAVCSGQDGPGSGWGKAGREALTQWGLLG